MLGGGVRVQWASVSSRVLRHCGRGQQFRTCHVLWRRSPLQQLRFYCAARQGGASKSDGTSGEAKSGEPDQTQTDQPSTLNIFGVGYPRDAWTNISSTVLHKLGSSLHRKKHHPLNLIHQRIRDHFYGRYKNRIGNPIYTMFDSLKPVVTTQQNFDSLLVPTDHVSRSPRDTYYINETHLLRAHTSAHQEELIRMGFDSFLVFGDVYRRDTIDSSHYPVFHQCEGVRLFSEYELFSKVDGPMAGLALLESGSRTSEKQEEHTMEAAKLLEHDLKSALLDLTRTLFGKDVQCRWVTEDVYFPFTHPSWELEILFDGEWMEVLGCGIIEQQILRTAGAGNKVGWAFGLGLDRLAMKLYSIPDIRLLWSQNPEFIEQFKVPTPDTPVTYKEISRHPPCPNNMSFWLPEPHDSFSSSDFYDLVRDVGGDTVQRVSLIDEFVHPKHQRTSHCYRIVYRHMERALTQAEVNETHQRVEKEAVQRLGVEIR